MSQIEELQGRIASALDRISQGLEVQATAQADPEEMAALQQSLEEERSAVQQLEERNKSLNDKIAALEMQVTGLQAEVAASAAAAPVAIQLPDMMGQVGATIAQLREANDTVLGSNERLREAHSAGVSEPHLINSGMMAELEGLKAMREMDKAELTAILETLEAVLGGNEGPNGASSTAPVQGGL
ncbi:MAG: hypothetical protein AAF231_08920 [Pseudomonadota bacterium]